MPRLCLISDAASPHTRKWLTGCAGLDWEIVVVSHRPAKIPGIQVYCHPMTLVGFFRYARGVRRLIRSLQPDIVHAHQFGAHGLYAWFAGAAPVIITAWGSDILVRTRKSRILRWLAKFQIKKAVLITSDSREVSHELLKLGAEPDKILTFPFGVPRVVFDRLQGVVKRQKPFIICSPRLHEPIYNLPVILDAFRMVQDEFPEARLWMLGDGSLTAELKEYVSAHRMNGRVVFWGRVSPDEFTEKLASSHVIVSIPSSDGTPISLLEGMAAGCLPVATDAHVYREWIVERVNGLLVEPNPASLSEALRTCMTDSDLLERAAGINRGLIKEKAITEDQFKTMIEHYKRIAGQFRESSDIPG